MNVNSGATGLTNYDKIFQGVIDALPGQLPEGLQSISPRLRPGNNFVVLRFPEFKYSQYELQFAKRSDNHARYWGKGLVDIVAFYFGNNAGGRDRRMAWLNEIQLFLKLIEEQMGRHIVSGPWGEKDSENWAWLATKIGDGEASRFSHETLSLDVAHFIQATYIPISTAFEKIDFNG